MASQFQEISTDLADFVSKMTLSITEAQRALDENAVDMLKELANQSIKIPQITHEIQESTNKVTTRKNEIKASLLDIGIRPTFYQFAETLIDVSIDMHIEEEINESSNKKRRMIVGTKNIRRERRYNRDLKAHSKLSVKMVPVPIPEGISSLVNHVQKT